MDELEEKELKPTERLFIKCNLANGNSRPFDVSIQPMAEGFCINLAPSYDIYSYFVEKFIRLFNENHPAKQINEWRVRYEEIDGIPQHEIRFYINYSSKLINDR